MNPSSITIYYSPDSYTSFSGSFSYDTSYIDADGIRIYDDLSGGVLRGISEYEEGSLVYSITGLNISATLFAEWVATNQVIQAKIQGLSGDDLIIGSPFDDFLEGWGGNDNLQGGEGNDTFVGGDGADTILGGNGIDLVDYSTAGAAIVADLSIGASGGGGSDTFTSIENLIGSSFGDEISGSFGINLIWGGDGDDTIDGLDNADILRGESGSDTLVGGFGDDDLFGGEGGDTLVGDEGIDELFGEAGDDYLISTNGAGENSAFSDRLDGGDGADFFVVDAGDRIVAFKADDDAIIFVTPQPIGNIQVFTDAGITEIRAWSLDLTTYESIWLEEGVDPAELSLETYSSNGENGVIIHRVAPATTQFEQVAIDVPATQAALIEAIAPHWDGVFIAALDDTYGFLQDYIIDDKNFAQALSTLVENKLVFAATTGLVQVLGKYIDIKDSFEFGAKIGEYLNAAYIYPNLWGTASPYRNADGTENISAHVDAIIQILIEIIPFGTTAYKFGSELFVEFANEIYSAIESGFLAIGPDIENLLETAAAGNGSNTFTNGPDLLFKLAGTSTYTAGDGDDTQLGTAPAAAGGATAARALFLSQRAGPMAAENDSFDGGQGIDSLVYSFALQSVSVDLTSGIANGAEIGQDTIINFENVYGGRGDDTLIGNGDENELHGGAGNDNLSGGGGNDVLVGGRGNDHYTVDGQGDLIIEQSGEGTDTVTATASLYLTSNLEGLTLAQGAGSIFGVGNDLANLLTGNEGENLLIAGAGDDEVRGGSARDAIFGQDGNDNLFGDAGIDYIVAGIGNDMIDGGDDPDEIYGEGGDDTIRGGDSFDTDFLVGGDGDDTIHGASGLGDYDLLYGNLGDDTFFVDTPADLVFEQFGEGVDTVFAGINGAGYYLFGNIENLTLTDSTPFGVGNELANTLTGNSIGNYLLGGGGNDILNGMAGNDVLFGEGGADTFVFGAGSGSDIIADFSIGLDKINIVGSFTSFVEVQSHIVQVGTNSAIQFDNGDVLIIYNVQANQLAATDFMFG